MKPLVQKQGGLKTNLKPDKGQKTLADSFKAGQLIKEAKARRKEALLGMDTIEVKF